MTSGMTPGMTLARIVMAACLAAALGVAACGVKGEPERPVPKDAPESES